MPSIVHNLLPIIERGRFHPAPLTHSIEDKMIKRRVKPGRKLKIKRRPKLSEWQLLYNRLQEDDDFDVYGVVSKHVGGDIELFDTLEMLCAKFTSKIETLQMNYPDHVSFRVYLEWKNTDAKPKHGYLYPRLCVVKTSPHLIRSATLAYLEICHYAGRWI